MKNSRYFQIIFMIIIGFSCHEKNQTRFGDGKWIDLSHSYDQNTPYWPTAEGFEMDTVFAGMTPGGYYYSAYQFSSAEHGGTHIDAPVHFAEGRQSVDEIPLENLTGLAIVIDVRDSVADYIDYQISVADFQNWEAINGKMPDDVIILINTGFARFWPDKLKYLGTDLRGAEAVALLHFPGLHPDAAQWLIDQRSVKAIGLDTPSIDYGRSSDFKSHRILFTKNIPVFENLANLDALPNDGAYIVALPMKIKGGSGGPLRIAAWVGI
jgi:kynurenine formamidase